MEHWVATSMKLKHSCIKEIHKAEEPYDPYNFLDPFPRHVRLC